MNKKRLLNSSIFFTGSLILWPFFMALSIPDESIDEQLRIISAAPLMHIINFSIALLIAPAMVLMLYSLYPFIADHIQKRYLSFSIFFFLMYFILISISYGSQVFYLPLIIKDLNDPLVMKWFFYKEDSNSIFINQSGYLSWSLGIYFFMVPSFVYKKGILKVAMLIFLLSAVLQTIATTGIYLNIQSLSGLSFISGVILLPAGILLVIFAWKTLN